MCPDRWSTFWRADHRLTSHQIQSASLALLFAREPSVCSDRFRMATSLEHMTADEVGEWLTEHGFSEDIVAAFEGQS